MLAITYQAKNYICMPLPPKWGRGVMASPQMSVRPASGCLHFVSGTEIDNPSINFGHTHPLGGVDVFFLVLIWD